MPTRFYLSPNVVAPVSPTFGAEWTHVNGLRRTLATVRAGTTNSTTGYSPDAADHLVAGDAMYAQWVSSTLDAQSLPAQTVTLAMQQAAIVAANNLFLAWKLFVWRADGTVGPTVLALRRDNTVLTTALTNRTDSATTTAVTLGQGDRLVLELGAGGTPTNTGGVQGHNFNLKVGDTAVLTDAPVNDTSTGALEAPWFEFATTTLVFYTATSGTASLRARPGAVATPQPSAYATAIQATAGLVGYWRLGEATGATRARDELNTTHGTYTGGPTLQQPGGPTTDANPSVAFDGINDLVALPNAFPFAGNVPYSIECWVNPDIISTTIYPVLVHHVDFAAPSKGWMLRLYRDTNRIQHERHFGNGTVQYSQTNSPIPTGSWHHVVATYDGTAVRLYVDGVDDTWYQDPDGVLVAATTAAGIGGIAGDVQFFDGRLDEVAIYNVALAPATVTAHYVAGGGVTGPRGVGVLRARVDHATAGAKGGTGTATGARARSLAIAAAAKAAAAVATVCARARGAAVVAKSSSGSATIGARSQGAVVVYVGPSTSGSATARAGIRATAAAARAAAAVAKVCARSRGAAVGVSGALGTADARVDARAAVVARAARATVAVPRARPAAAVVAARGAAGTARPSVRARAVAFIQRPTSAVARMAVGGRLASGPLADGTIASDTFTRADNPASLGTADSGQVWSPLAGTWGVSGTKAVVVSGAGHNQAVIESGQSNASVQASLSPTGFTQTATPGLMVRVQGAGNGLGCRLVLADQQLVLFKLVGGVYSQLAAASYAPYPTTMALRVTCEGARIKCYINDTLWIDQDGVTDFQTATQHGLYAFGAANTTWDDFSVSGSVAGPKKGSLGALTPRVRARADAVGLRGASATARPGAATTLVAAGARGAVGSALSYGLAALAAIGSKGTADEGVMASVARLAGMGSGRVTSAVTRLRALVGGLVHALPAIYAPARTPRVPLQPIRLGGIYRGDTIVLPIWQARAANDQVIPLAGATLWWTAKADLASADDDPPVVQVSSEDGGIAVLDAEHGLYRVTLDPDASAHLTEDLVGTFDVQVRIPSPEAILTVKRGSVAIVRDVTRATGGGAPW